MILEFIDNRGSRGFIVDTDVELNEPTAAVVKYDDSQGMRKYLVNRDPDSDIIVRLFEFGSRFERFLSEFSKPLPDRCIVDETRVRGNCPIVFIAQPRGSVINAELVVALKAPINVSIIDGQIHSRHCYKQL